MHETDDAEKRRVHASVISRGDARVEARPAMTPDLVTGDIDASKQHHHHPGSSNVGRDVGSARKAILEWSVIPV